MSKVHQALMKAEGKGKTNVNEGLYENLLEEMKEVLAPRFSENSKIEREAPASPEAKVAPVPQTIPSVELAIQSSSKLVSYLDPKSIASEQYRALKTKVFQLHQTCGFKTLLVTSAGALEGKTTTATNLALTMAQEIHIKVLLIDGDLRRPAVHKSLGISVPLGLSDYLSEKCPVEQVIYSSQIQNFCVVAGGPIPNNPVELLNSQRMRSLMTYVSDRFDWVVVDSPPIAALSDADILASMTHGVLVVVRALHTPADLLEKAMEALKGKNVLGIVFNGHEDDKVKSYSYYYPVTT
jgi:capsular exopolysaccharide synthesis family protein